MKKETKEKVKSWCANTLPTVGIAAVGYAGLIAVYKTYNEKRFDVYQQQMQQRTDNYNQSYINFLSELLEHEKTKNESE